MGRPQTNQNYHTQNVASAVPTFKREAMTESAMLSRKIPMTAKNAVGGELTNLSAVDQLASRPTHLPERTMGLRSSLDRTGNLVPGGPKMRLKSANAGARPHIFKRSAIHGSPDGKQLFLPNLPNLNDNGGDSQAAPDAASYGQ